MADITMCDNQECRFRATCYRFRAIPSDYQSYAIFNEGESDNPDEVTCEHYIEFINHTRQADKAVNW